MFLFINKIINISFGKFIEYYCIVSKYNKILLLNIENYISFKPGISPIARLSIIYKRLIFKIS
jgi:hypothetical protein